MSGQTIVECGCRLFMVAINGRLEAPDIEFCATHEAAGSLLEALKPIAAAYEDNPGTSDLDNDQPVRITLGDVRRAWAAIAKATK